MSTEVWDVLKLLFGGVIGWGLNELQHRCILKVELSREERRPKGFNMAVITDHGARGLETGPTQVMLVVTIKNAGRVKVKLRDFNLLADGKALDLTNSQILNEHKDINFEDPLEPRVSRRVYLKPGRIAEFLKKAGVTQKVKLTVKVRDDLDKVYQVSMDFTPDNYEVSPETVTF